ncbi:CHAD domain-containing protein [Streptomyces kaniharaensis]|uniref:CHAD domain-containing protein n=1 Tax=Streptomyces kaniharaensis TaxID=212423 RepID=A0A6N7KRD5_9ACTN|nr:CHAD domain-containing protein [Streptomyces kaniharaensis]MQS12918.1 CHAD domain-containing protein [Streptomyces kaniharaensis]
MTDAPMTAQAASTMTAGEILSSHLTAQAGAFLRALPLAVGEVGARPGTAVVPAAGTADLLRAVRRIGGLLHTFGTVFDQAWAQESRTELRWLLNLLALEPGYVRRSARLLGALDSLSGTDPDGTGMLAGHAGAPKARALLDRQLTLARTRAHSTVLQELRSARLHALADRMTLLVGEAPLLESAGGRAGAVLLPQASAAFTALSASAAKLPLQRAAKPYGGDGLRRLGAAPSSLPARGLGAPPARQAGGEGAGAPGAVDADAALAADDAPWARLRILVKRARYALEVCGRPAGELDELDAVLGWHQEAADAAVTAATAARTPRITPATAYVLGVVHADQRLEVEAARYAFGRRWPELPPGPDGWLEIPPAEGWGQTPAPRTA